MSVHPQRNGLALALGASAAQSPSTDAILESRLESFILRVRAEGQVSMYMHMYTHTYGQVRTRYVNAKPVHTRRDWTQPRKPARTRTPIGHPRGSGGPASSRLTPSLPTSPHVRVWQRGQTASALPIASNNYCLPSYSTYVGPTPHVHGRSIKYTRYSKSKPGADVNSKPRSTYLGTYRTPNSI